MENNAWHDNARFRIFTECDVYMEGGNYLYVENEAFNYNGFYTCCPYQQGTNLDGSKFYLEGDFAGADNKYIMGLEKAPWNIAKDVISRYLLGWQHHEELLEESGMYDDLDDGISGLIEEARYSLENYAVENEKFVF